MDKKSHFKMYKDGKRWCVMGIMTLAVATALGATAVDASADTNANVNPSAGTQVTATTATTNSTSSQSQPAVNQGYLDSMQVHNGQLTMSGWHATNEATNMPNHYIIVLANGHELGRTKATTVQRQDVAKVLPNVKTAAQSGWQAGIKISPAMIGNNLQVVSRYTSSEDGNSNYVDFWYPLRNLGYSTDNRAYLDSYRLADGHFHVSGWNATDYSVVAPYHFLILYDRTTNRQISSKLINNSTRNDVFRVYPQIKTAAQSGFNADLGAVNLNPNDKYALVSRYSTVNTGNGDQGTYYDNWINVGSLDQQFYSWVDGIQQSGNKIQVKGWLASNQRSTKPYAYLIVLNNGREVGRARINNFLSRPDVGRVYPKVANSAISGFNQSVTVNPNRLTGTMSVIVRITDDPAGNGHFIDHQTHGYSTSASWFDSLKTVGNNLVISGWQASMRSADKPVRILIITDASGHELYRQQIQRVSRADVAKVYPYIGEAENSGFNISLPLTDSLRNKALHIYIRSVDSLTNDNNADHYVDLVGKVAPGGGLYYIDGDWYNFARDGQQRGNGIIHDLQSVNPAGRHVAIAIQSQVNGQVVSWTNSPGWQGQVASTIKVAVLAMLLHNTGGNLNSTQMDLATRMIRNSDNQATDNIIDWYLGGSYGLQAIFNDLGMSHTKAGKYWWYIRTTPEDQLKLLNQIYLVPSSTYLNEQSRQIIRNLMGSVNPSQTWGISAGSSRFYIKNGWNWAENTYGQWNINSIGFIPGSDNDGYTIAVYTYSSPNVSSGAALIEQYARAIRNEMF